MLAVLRHLHVVRQQLQLHHVAHAQPEEREEAVVGGRARLIR